MNWPIPVVGGFVATLIKLVSFFSFERGGEAKKSKQFKTEESKVKVHTLRLDAARAM